MPKDNEVDEKVIWTTDKPTTEGAYYIRGFNVCRPADEQFEALVQVRMHKPNFFASEESATLFCNLHESTSEEDMDNWIPVDELEDDFEWSGPLAYAATVAELRAEVAEQSARADKWKALHDAVSLAHEVQAKSLTRALDRADAAERRVVELEADARRYRYLRDNANPDSDEGFAVTTEAMNGWGKWYTVHISGADLDSAIDTATGADPT